MKNILLNTTEIESAWEKNDACFVRTLSGKTWVCNKHTSVNNILIATKDHIYNNPNKVVKIDLATKGGKHGKQKNN